MTGPPLPPSIWHPRVVSTRNLTVIWISDWDWGLFKRNSPLTIKLYRFSSRDAGCQTILVPIIIWNISAYGKQFPSPASATFSVTQSAFELAMLVLEWASLVKAVLTTVVTAVELNKLGKAQLVLTMILTICSRQTGVLRCDPIVISDSLTWENG